MEGLVIKLPKREDLRDCSNYRGIMLLSVPYIVLKVLTQSFWRE
jgi:hypothetical protein